MPSKRYVPVGRVQLVDLDPASRTRARVSGTAPALTLAHDDLPRGWALLEVTYRTRDAVAAAPPILRTFTTSNPQFPGRLRFSRKRRDQFTRVVFVPDDLTEVTLELPGASGYVDVVGPNVRPISKSGAFARMIATQVAAFARGETSRRDTMSRTWSHLREGGFSGLRRHVVTRYDALQDQRGAGAREDAIRYEEWRSLYAVLDDVDRAKLDARIAAIESPPLISIVVPVYDTPEKFLRRMIDSVVAQRYPRWELCLANDASPSPHLRDVLDRVAAADPRIKVVHRTENGHISACSNSALELATGEYVALLDHDDELPEYALAVMALHLTEHPEHRLVYSDEDKIDERGRHYDPFFKPPWNPELLESQNYIGHFLVIDRSLLTEVGGFRLGYEGSQDYDLLFRLTERLDAAQIGNVPHILYHWRAIAGSTARSTSQKSYAEEAGVRAVQDHLDRTGRGASAGVGRAPTTYHVTKALIDTPFVSIVIPTRDQVALLRTAVDSVLERTTDARYEILIVDNQSSDPETLGYLEHVDRHPSVRVIPYNAPFNYSALNNHAVAIAEGDYVCLLNNDTEVITPEWLTEMLVHGVRPEIGAVGAKLRYGDGSIQHGGVILGMGGVAGHGHKFELPDSFGYFCRLECVHDVGAVTGACLLTRRTVWDEVGGLDEAGLAVAFNDIDYCLKAADAGYRVVYTPWAELYHYESKSRGAEDTLAKQKRFQGETYTMLERWGDRLLTDPSFNPNLSLDHENFCISEAPRVRLPWL